jgi:hypothetical protein
MRVVEQEKLISDRENFKFIEEKFSIKFPHYLKGFMIQYEGSFVKETCYKGTITFKEVLYVYKREGFASIESILEGHKENGIEGFIPFAIDSGGWDYNVSINVETYGQVWVNKFDSGEKETMEYIAPSFEEFIDNLKPEE